MYVPLLIFYAANLLMTCDCSNISCDFTPFLCGKSYLFPQCTGHV